MNIRQRRLLVLLMALGSLLGLALSFAGCSSSKLGRAGTTTATGEAGAGTSASPATTSSADSASADAANAANGAGQLFRGVIGDRPIVMRLQRSGDALTGTYYYEGIGQNLTLRGSVDGSGKLSLQEFDASGKQTGKFSGRWANESDQQPANSIEGDWSQPDGGHQTFFEASEQHINFTGNLQIVSKTIHERRPSINVSYPQLAGSSDPAIARFNQQVQKLITDGINEFKDGDPEPDRSSYSANYDVMLATDRFISVEIAVDEYAGGAHPDSSYNTVNYDLRTGREPELQEMFKPGADYQTLIRQYALKDLNARARKDAADSHEPQQEDLFTEDQLSEWSGWTITPRGIVVYFDFPHAIAVYSREFIPARVLKDQLKGPE